MQIEDDALAGVIRQTKAILDKGDILPENTKAIRGFLDFKRARSSYTLRFYIAKLRDLSSYCNKPFLKMSKEDIRAFLDSRRDKKPRTRNGYIACLKVFFRWLHKLPPHQFPDCVAWLEKERTEPVIKSRHELISKDEFRAMLLSTKDPRIRAYMTMSLEGLYRRNEIRLMRIKDVIIKDTHALAYSYEAKTHKSNMKPLVFSKPYLVEWLNQHPFRDDPESPLFIPLRPPRKKFLALNVFYYWLKDCIERVGIEKKMGPHRLRHLRVTLMLLSGDVPKDTLRSLGGWTTNQMLDSTYAHIDKEDHIKKVLTSYGIEQADPAASDVQVRKCMVCSHIVSELEEYCPNCRNVPSIEIAEKEQAKLLQHEKTNEAEVKDLKERMGRLETYVKKKLVQDIVRGMLRKGKSKKF